MFYIPHEIQSIIFKLNNSGYNSFYVGGCVRDYLLKQKPKDFDIVTMAILDEIKHLFLKIISTGEKHNTLTVFKGSYSSEITSIFEDKHKDFIKLLRNNLVKRDFSINSLAMDINGEIYDYSDGKNDLIEKIIKFNANADEKIKEDPLMPK